MIAIHKVAAGATYAPVDSVQKYPLISVCVPNLVTIQFQGGRRIAFGHGSPCSRWLLGVSNAPAAWWSAATACKAGACMASPNQARLDRAFGCAPRSAPDSHQCEVTQACHWARSATSWRPCGSTHPWMSCSNGPSIACLPKRWSQGGCSSRRRPPTWDEGACRLHGWKCHCVEHTTSASPCTGPCCTHRVCSAAEHLETLQCLSVCQPPPPQLPPASIWGPPSTVPTLLRIQDLGFTTPPAAILAHACVGADRAARLRPRCIAV